MLAVIEQPEWSCLKIGGGGFVLYNKLILIDSPSLWYMDGITQGYVGHKGWLHNVSKICAKIPKTKTNIMCNYTVQLLSNNGTCLECVISAIYWLVDVTNGDTTYYSRSTVHNIESTVVSGVTICNIN